MGVGAGDRMSQFIKWMATFLGMVIILGLLAFLRSPIEPQVWTPPKNAGFTGGFAPNDALSSMQLLRVPGHGPEDVSCLDDGSMVTGLEDGRIIRVKRDGSMENIGDTGGRPVGLEGMPDGSVIIADALRGLVRLQSDGSLDVLVSEFEGRPVLFADDLDVTSDGVVWFSDASQRFSIDGFMLDFLEASATGRLLSYNLGTGELQSHLDGLFFANGVALGPDEAYVLVNETVTGRVHRLWLKGEEPGSHDIFVDQIPAMVDNISFNGTDTFWVASPNPRHTLEALADKPLLRKLVGGLPAWVSGSLKEHFSMVSGFDLEGNLISSFRDPDARLNQITSVNECDGKLVMGSLISDSMGILELTND